MKKKIAIIAVLILAVIGFMFYAAIKRSSKNTLELKEAGYIINSQKLTGNNASTGQIYYFNAQTKYQKTYDDKITFKDTEGNTAKVLENSFVHYENDSIGVLKKAVIVNLEDVLNNNLQYYNIFQNNLLIKSGTKYEFDNLGHTIRFKDFIVKTDENKYLIVAEGMKIVLDDGREVDATDNYIEVSIVDEEVVRLDNKNINLQTIGKESSIKFADNTYLNLDNHYIFREKEPLFTLDQMIINSQDNINITELEKEKEPEEETPDVQYDENGNVINNNNNTEEEYGNNGGGNVGGGGSAFIQEETEVDETTSKIPTATIEDIEITSNKIRANVKITDDDSLMSDKTIVTITENSTGRHIYDETFDVGQYSFEISADNLEPNTTYNFTVRVSYTREEIDYVIDVISQLFTTEALGINLEKEYATSSELSYNLRFDDYSRTKSCDVSIRNTNGDVLETINVEAAQAKTAEGYNVVFSELERNTKYIIVVDNILYDNTIIGEEYNMQTSAKTLKDRPTFGGLSFSIDKKNSSFTLSLNNIKDVDNGIETYRYELYDARTYGPDAQPVKTVEKQARGSVEIQLDEKTVQRGVPYIYRVVTEFYDNEKYIEYITPLSDMIQMDGVEGARLEWTAQEITFERIKGFITITDPSNTIDLNNQMTVVYTNSIGTTKQFTTAGNLIVPININNLRANETYNIAIYATVDFQDGNGKVDSYYVGSVTVTTNPTKSFTAAFGAPDETSSQAFSISVQLQQDAGGIDNTLEASTLTGITVSLIEGRSANGKIIKQVKLVDRDLREYYSDLKDSLYDNSITINPAFFSLSNSDINAEYLTLMISDAYDYTDFKNPIEIVNNVRIVKANNLMPDMPQNTDDAIQTMLIRNRNADAAHQDPNLDGDTVVGIRIKSLYDNTRHYAKYIDYSVYDAKTNRKLDLDVRYTVPDNGTIDFVDYYFDYGTPYDVEDNTLRRGNTYYFTYTAGLKLGTGDTITQYPVDDTVLKSTTVDINKQPATIITYPSSSNTRELTLKYKIIDLDNALYDDNFYAKQGTAVDSLIDVSNAPVEVTDTFKTTTLTNLTDGYLGIFVKQALIKNENKIKETRLSLDYFKNPSVLPPVTYTMDVDVNRLIFAVDGYDEENSSHQKIAGLKATFTSGGREIVKDYQIIDDNNFAVVDLFELAQFKGNLIKVKLEAYYDSNKAGYDLEGPLFAIQRSRNEYGGGNYYTIIDNQRLYDNGKVAMKNIADRVITQDEIILSSKTSGYRIVIPFAPDTQGFLFNYEYLNLKELSLLELAPSGTDEFVFNTIVPGIKLTNNQNESTIVPEIRTVNISGELYGFGLSELQNDLIYAEIYETDENGISMRLIKTASVTTEQFTAGFEIDGLMPGTNYAAKFYGNILNDNGIFEKTYLYDVDANTNNRTYYFKTLSSVPITGIRHSLSFVSYNDKTLKFSYKLGKLVGYDKITYELYKQGQFDPSTGEYEWTKVEVDIPESTRFTSIMNFDVDISPGSPIEFGQRYRLFIRPVMVVEQGDETRDVELGDPGIYTFSLRKLSSPTFSVRSTLYNEDDYIVFNVSIFDTNKVIVGGTYSIRITDSQGNDVTKEEYQNVEYSINNINKEFEIRDITPQELYTLTIYYKADMKNNRMGEQTYRSFTTRAINATGIDVGDVSAGPNLQDSRKIDLTFSHSNKLDKVDTISYSIYNTSDGTSYPTVEEAFTPEEIRVNGVVLAYKYTLNGANLTDSGIYLIQMQFTSNDTLVSEITTEYTYINNGG